MGAKRLFLSCVTNEFGSYRSVLADALSESGQIDVEKQETFRAYGDRTLLMLDEYIRGCDCVVHIVGSQTGAIATAADRKPLLERYSYVFLQNKLGLNPEVVDSLSYTQWEAWLAVLHGRKLYICQPADTAQRDAILQDSEIAAKQHELQQQHLRLLEAQGRYAESSLRFSDQNGLSVGLLRSIRLSSNFGDSEKIVPKGLLQFDESAAGFYLKLLPPPYGKNGVPEIVQHWKTTLESEPNTVSVGVLLGVSGSGKSSFFRAGVVPILDRTTTGKFIEPVFFQASFRETEQKLQLAIRSRLRLDDKFPHTDSLTEFFNQFLTSDLAQGQKVVVIVDQFEQWLQFWDRKADHDLIQAMKRCKNSSVQFVLIVREEFFSAIHRFMESLGDELTQKNYRVMQAFDLEHAKNVLTAFGQAYNCIGTPPAATELQFIDSAVRGLANETGNEVVCVRLSMFADMMRSRKWTIANWREVGGLDGLGVKFLRQKFDDSKEQRFTRHRDGVKEVLRCLLPERGVELKTQVPASQLQLRSGYSNKDSQFKEMMKVLEDELRIVTSSDSEYEYHQIGDAVGGSISEPYYQLAHDFLVPAVREWLSLTQKSTPGGRAMLLLESRSAAWHLDDKHTAALPSMREYLAIRFRTQKYAWSDKQRIMMVAARKQFRRRLLTLCVAASLIMILSSYLTYVYRRDLARQAVDRLVNSPFERIDEPIVSLNSFPILGKSILLDKFAREESQEKRTKCELALFPSSPQYLQSLKQQLLDPDTTPECFTAIKRTFAIHEISADIEASAAIMGELDARKYCRVLLACSAEVQLEQCRRDREKAARNIANLPSRDLPWVREHVSISAINEVRDELVNVYQDDRTNQNQRLVLASILAWLPDDRKGESTRTALILTAESKESFDDVLNEIRSRPASLSALIRLLKIRTSLRTPLPREASEEIKSARIKNEQEVSRMWSDAGFTNDFVVARRDEIDAATYITLAMVDEFDPLWELLGDKDKFAISIRSYVISQLPRFGVPRRKLIVRLLDQILNEEHAYREFEVASLLLAIGNYSEPLEESEKQKLVEAIGSRLSSTSSSYVLSAGEWFFQTQGIPLAIARSSNNLNDDKATRQAWELNKFGQRFTLVDPDQPQFKGLIERGGKATVAEKIAVPDGAPLQPFWFATHEVTVAQWRQFKVSRGEQFDLPKNQQGNEIYPTPADNCPIGRVLRQDALEYCNWLSKEHGYSPVYTPINGKDFWGGYKMAASRGYRLPLDYEWEIATRAGSPMRRFYGSSDALLSQYAYCNKPPQTGKYAEVGTVMPNSLGIFDSLGNAMEWCHNVEAIRRDSLEGMHLRGAAYLIFPSNIDHKATKERKIDDKVGDWVDGIRLVRWVSEPTKTTNRQQAAK